MITYTSDAILFAKTMQALDYKPPMLLADDAGYSDPSFIKAVGKISQGAFNRSSWSVGPPGSPTAIIAEMYKEKSGDEMDDTAARQMQGFFVLCEAIDRAGSTDPAKIQAALKATDLKPEQLMMGYKGVKFDDKGQNIAGLRRHHPAAGRRELCRGLAEGATPRSRRSCPTRAGDDLEGRDQSFPPFCHHDVDQRERGSCPLFSFR